MNADASHAQSEHCERCHEPIKGRPVEVGVIWTTRSGLGVTLCHDCGAALERWLETAPVEASS